MTPQQILEGNKIIAEFAGYTVFEKRYPRNHGIGAPEAFENYKPVILHKAKFHSSWDWLMPVIEKIVNKQMDESNKNAFEYRKNASEIINSLILLKINYVWQSTIEFINWYNKQK